MDTETRYTVRQQSSGYTRSVTFYVWDRRGIQPKALMEVFADLPI